MVKSLLTLIILLILNSVSANADEINEFQIEGISIGDTALKILNRSQILEEFKIGKDEYSWTDQKFTDLYSYTSNSYDKLVMAVKRKDPEFIIYAISGQIDYKEIKQCFEKQNEIEKIFDDMFSNTKKDKWTQKHTQDKTGKSEVHWIVYSFNTGDKVELICFDMAKHMKQPSGLDVGIVSAEYRNWLNSF